MSLVLLPCGLELLPQNSLSSFYTVVTHAVSIFNPCVSPLWDKNLVRLWPCSLGSWGKEPCVPIHPQKSHVLLYIPITLGLNSTSDLIPHRFSWPDQGDCISPIIIRTQEARLGPGFQFSFFNYSKTPVFWLRGSKTPDFCRAKGDMAPPPEYVLA